MKKSRSKPKQNMQLMKLTATALLAILVSLVIAVTIVVPYLASPDTFATAQIVLSDGTIINLDSRDAQISTAAIVSQTGSGPGITSNVGSVINKINTNLYVTPRFTGTIKDYTITGGTFTVYINNVDANGKMTTSVTSFNRPLDLLHPKLVDGQSVIIASSTVDGSNAIFVDAIKRGAISPGHTYQLRNIITGFEITGTFTDDTPFHLRANDAEIKWNFKYT